MKLNCFHSFIIVHQSCRVDMMSSSYSLSLSGDKSIISSDYFPPIVLNGNYECGLVELQTFNSIPNIDETNNKFHYGENADFVELPIGSYEIDDISKTIQDLINESEKTTENFRNDYNNNNNNHTFVSILPNNNTLKCSLKCTKIVHFDKENSIGSVS